MNTLDNWVKRSSASAPEVVHADSATASTPTKRRRSYLRSNPNFRTEEMIEEVHKVRVLWSREARGFHSKAVRHAAYKRVAATMNRRFPELPPWDAFEVNHHWRLLVQQQLACFTLHDGPNAKPHSTFCRHKQMSWMNDSLQGITDWHKFIWEQL
ncbi:hypothetical protein AAVH_15723 [Aphelenchoides avenae]|nr:hypothetical protein AAVH_15723 [Aphelenchus avenae]